MRRTPVVVLLCASLVLVALPITNAKPRVEDIAIGGTDPTSGASGQFWLHYENGELTFISGYAGTWAWQAGAWWSPSGGWQFGEVSIFDPDAIVPDDGRTFFGFARIDPFDGDPTFDPPTNPPTNPLQGVPCQDCINAWRDDCRRVAAAGGAVAVAGGATFVTTCMPAAIPGIPVTLGGSEVACFVGAVAIVGTGVWAAKKAQKQCSNQAPISCSDPNTGKPCYQLGYK